MNTTIQKLRGKDTQLSHGTHLQTYINDITFRDIVNILGRPSIIGSGDGKMQFEWVIGIRVHGSLTMDIVTLYDWKTYDVEYTKNELTRWNIGGHDPISASEFRSYLERELIKMKVGA